MHMAKQVIYVLDQCQKDPTKDQCYHPFLFQITPEENTMNNKFKPIIVFKTFTVLSEVCLSNLMVANNTHCCLQLGDHNKITVKIQKMLVTWLT